MKHREAIMLLTERINYYKGKIQKQQTRHKPDGLLIDTYQKVTISIEQSIETLKADQP